MDPLLAGSAQLLRTSDHYLRRSIAGLEPEDLRRRIGRANSIHWIVGHVTIGRCRLLRLVGGENEIPWVEVFGKGSSEREGVVLPEIGEVLALWDGAGAEVAERLERLDEPGLARQGPYDLPGSGQTVLGTINYFAFHEAYHIGQISQARKALEKGLRRRTIEAVVARLSAEETAP